MTPAITGPIPPYQNLPINAQFYQPSQFVITAITLGYPTIVTTAQNHNYVVSQNVRLLIPEAYGAQLLNGQEGYVISIPAANQVAVQINSNQSDAFIPSPITSNLNLPQIVAIGNILNGVTNGQGNSNTGTSTPGAFINISPL